MYAGETRNILRGILYFAVLVASIKLSGGFSGARDREDVSGNNSAIIEDYMFALERQIIGDASL